MLNSILLTTLALLALLPSAALAGPPGPAGPVAVVVARIATAQVTPVRDYVGHVEPLATVDLKARVEAFVEKVRFQEGAFVKAGDILFQLEAAPFRARVASAEAAVKRAEAKVFQAASRLKRLKTAGPESVSATDMDNALADDRLAAADLAAARATLKLARIDLAYTTITAPISGRIGRAFLTAGNLAEAAAAPLARIVQMDPIRVVFSVSETELPLLQALLAGRLPGHQALPPPKLQLSDGSSYPVTGRFAFLDNQVDPATGTIAVRAEFANPDHLLFPGQYVTVQILTAAPRRLPVVPQAAVLANREGRYVLMVDKEGKVVTRPITTGAQVGTSWAVRKGLRGGEEVIVAGIQKVRPGMRVTVVRKPDGGRR